MKNFHPFFTIGTVGMIVTAIFHMFMALTLSITSSHTAFFSMYPVFLTFLVIGIALTIKQQKASNKAF